MGVAWEVKEGEVLRLSNLKEEKRGEQEEGIKRE